MMNSTLKHMLTKSTNRNHGLDIFNLTVLLSPKNQDIDQDILCGSYLAKQMLAHLLKLLKQSNNENIRIYSQPSGRNY